MVRTDSEKSYASSQRSENRSNRSEKSDNNSHRSSQKSDNHSNRLSQKSDNHSNRSKRSRNSTGSPNKLVRSGSYSTTRTLASDVEKLSFDSDSEVYDLPTLADDSRIKLSPLSRSDSKSGLTRVDSKKSTKWGYGWGLGKAKERERDMLERSPSVDSERPPLYKSPTRTSSRSSGSKRPPFYSNDSGSTLVGSAYERKINDVESIKEKVDTAERLEEIRKLMAKEKLDY